MAMTILAMRGPVAAAALLLAFVGAAPPAPAQRIVTLVPSFAADLVAIGAGSQIVGVSAYTDVPQAAALPRVGDAGGIDAERIVTLHPDAIVGIPAQARSLEPLRRIGLKVVLLRNDTFGDIFTDLTALGKLSGHAAQAAAFEAASMRRTDAIRAQVRRFVRRPSVFVVLGTGPIWTVGKGSYIATLVAMADGRNAADDLHAAYGEYSAEALLRDRPDVLLADPLMHVDSVLDREPWRSLRAVQHHRVFTIDPPDMLMQPGPLYNEGLAWLVKRQTPLAR